MSPSRPAASATPTCSPRSARRSRRRAELEELLERLAAVRTIPTFADVCGVYVLGDDALHLLSIHGVDTSVTDEVRRLFSIPIPLDDDNPLSLALADGTPRVYDVEFDSLFDRPDIGKSRHEWLDRVLRPRSLLVVPMRVRNRTMGLLAFNYTAESDRGYTSDDLDVGAELARRCALILDQVSAHAETARARDRADRLQRFAAAMARAASVDAVVRVVVEEGADAIGADLANLALPAVDSASLRVYHSPRNATDMADWARVALDADIPITDVVRRGRPVYLRDVDEFAAAFPKSLDTLLGSDMQSVVALPLAGSEGEIIGSVAFAFTEPRAFDSAQRTLLETIADISAQSLDRALLYERERVRRADAAGRAPPRRAAAARRRHHRGPVRGRRRGRHRRRRLVRRSAVPRWPHRRSSSATPPGAASMRRRLWARCVTSRPRSRWSTSRPRSSCSA